MERAVFLTIGYSCNINCCYCFYTTGHSQRGNERLDIASTHLLSRNIVASGIDLVILTGGEPLHRTYRETTFQLISELKRRGVGVSINTSGTDLNENDLARIVGLGVDSIDISIDSHDENIHNLQRGLFGETLGTITRLLSMGYPNIRTTTVLTDLNASEISKTIAFLKELGVRDCMVQPAYVPGSEPSESVLRAIEEFGGCIRNLYPNIPRQLPSDAVCQMGRRYFVCEPSGEIRACFHSQDGKLANLIVDSPELVKDVLDAYGTCNPERPKCFGPHCASLFNIRSFWKEGAEHVPDTQV